MLPDRVSNPRPLTYESGALPIALRGPAVRLTDRPDMTLDVYRGRKTTMQQQQQQNFQCYRLLCSCVYGLKQYVPVNKSCPFCFLF